ncbi:MAG: hypothetical protein JNL28_15700 [Planctomycetes bacterium]|nr:hypothetical protein [Planctomycetota bacterium]
MKILVRIALALVLLVGIGLLVAVLMIDKLVKAAIETGGSRAAGVSVTLSSADVSLGAGGLGLSGFAIHNPKGFKDEPFVSIGSAQAKWQNSSLLSREMVVEEFELSGVQILLEHRDGGTNFGPILDALAGGGKAAPGPEAEASSRTLIVKRIVVRDVKASVFIAGLTQDSAGVVIPKIELNDFRSDGSTTEIVGALTRTIVDALLSSTLDAGGKNLPKEILSGLERKVDALKSEAKGVLDRAKDLKDAFKKLK